MTKTAIVQLAYNDEFKVDVFPDAETAEAEYERRAVALAFRARGAGESIEDYTFYFMLERCESVEYFTVVDAPHVVVHGDAQ